MNPLSAIYDMLSAADIFTDLKTRIATATAGDPARLDVKASYARLGR
jgi:hypothetical protein